MNSQKIIKGKLFLAVLVTMLCGMVAGGCSDDKDELEGKQYGYVQFKLYKSSSYTCPGSLPKKKPVEYSLWLTFSISSRIHWGRENPDGCGVYPRLRAGQAD